ncbi:MAG: hypothetical protein JRI23_30515 [Deltaproteobacteria bacterium]|nr:hypothetical protein [Deltaproteobacteria bacterium]MBW2536516.1 hypothetical protein [Deltaproteobacteria bacterium]
MRRSSFACAIGCSAAIALGMFGCDDEETTTGPTGGSTTTQSTSSTSSTSAAGGSGGVCQNDDHEPNDSATTATELPDLTDEDPEPSPELSGTIAGGSDTDWYVYDGEDAIGVTVVDPERSFENPATVLRLCAYFWCNSTDGWGTPDIGSEGGSGAGGGSGSGGGPPIHVCPDGTEEVTEDLSAITYEGRNLGVASGCCTEPGTTSFQLGGYFPTVHWPLDCPGLLDPDHMRVFIRVEKYATQEDDLCEPYTVLYHF